MTTIKAEIKADVPQGEKCSYQKFPIAEFCPYQHEESGFCYLFQQSLETTENNMNCYKCNECLDAEMEN